MAPGDGAAVGLHREAHPAASQARPAGGSEEGRIGISCRNTDQRGHHDGHGAGQARMELP